MRERWLPVVGYEGMYEVSDLGRVRSIDRVVTSGRRWKARIRKLIRVNDGALRYLTVVLSRGSKVVCRSVHVLVLEAFSGPRPAGHQARHLNGKPHDNSFKNLKWGTPKENGQDRVLHGRSQKGAQNSQAKLTETKVARARILAKKGSPMRRIAAQMNVSPGLIGKIISRKLWSHV